ncbi:Hsp20/alpha crystallin family protein [Candidatus Chlorohelix sp.]|uniref:Hsp20/alpha crystallin family protein n=1 Tax=Candidatus Chlorohelix sp. TaxID=3139201 RepID=UPI00305F4F78
MNAIERWSPFQELETVRNNMYKMFDRWFDEGFEHSPSVFSPAVDLVQTEDGYELHANMPGYKPEEIEINIEGDMLTLRAKCEQSEEKKEKNYVYHERRSGSFYRSMRLPEPIDPEKTEAKMESGVLTLSLPRLAQKEVHKIEVKTK